MSQSFLSRPLRFHRPLVVFNPAAGARHRRVEKVLQGLCALGCRPELLRTTRRGDAEDAAREAGGLGFDLIVAAGGDGTINELANGLVTAADPLPLAILPLGTANVLAAEIGLKATVPAVMSMIANGRSRRIHLGRAGERHFLLMASAGLDAAVVNGVDLKFKRQVGQLAYGVEAVRQVFDYRFPELTATIDGVVHTARMVVVCRAGCYGGPFKAAPEADITGDRLHVVMFKRGGPLSLMRYVAALALGGLDRLADVLVVAGQSVAVGGPNGAPLQADGDILGALPIEISVSSRTIELLMP
ncbi:MAG: diacylglycerol kinase family protein [Rhodospirillaceae bacterium]